MTISLLSPEDLAGRLAHDPPIVVDARPCEEHDLGHIPGAVSLDWTDWCAPAPTAAPSTLHQPGYWGSLLDRSPQWYATRLGALGIGSERDIVVYADGPRSRGREGRIAWMLLYLGAPSVALLDGGWRAWRHTGGRVDQSRTVLPPNRFTVHLQPERRCRRDDLAELVATERPLLVDTRSPEEFAGRLYRYQPRMGHLPDARLVPFTDLFLPSDQFLDAPSYRERVPAAVQQAPALVAYCEVGVRACTFALLHEVHTGTVVAVYDGSIMEWSLDPDLPIEAAG